MSESVIFYRRAKQSDLEELPQGAREALDILDTFFSKRGASIEVYKPSKKILVYQSVSRSDIDVGHDEMRTRPFVKRLSLLAKIFDAKLRGPYGGDSFSGGAPFDMECSSPHDSESAYIRQRFAVGKNKTTDYLIEIVCHWP